MVDLVWCSSCHLLQKWFSWLALERFILGYKHTYIFPFQHTIPYCGTGKVPIRVQYTQYLPTVLYRYQYTLDGKFCRYYRQVPGRYRTVPLARIQIIESFQIKLYLPTYTCLPQISFNHVHTWDKIGTYLFMQIDIIFLKPGYGR